MDKNKMLCELLEIEYIEKMRKKLNFEGLNEIMIYKILFPNEWSIIDDEIKLSCLKEAIEENKTLIETTSILTFYKQL